jgi:alpha-1,6-mannosyltransferase
MRIVRLANFVAPCSGGMRTALRELGAGYVAAGHESVLVIPGPEPRDEDTDQGRVVTLPGPVVPGTGGYRVIATRRPVRRLLEELRPDRVEVSDRTTLRWLGSWASKRGIPSMMVSHDSAAGLIRMFGPRQLPLDWISDRLNLATANSYDVVLCTTEWAAAEFRRIGVPNLVRVPLGVDLARFGPDRWDERLRSSLATPDEALLVHCSRLSPEKSPERAVEALAELRHRGVPASLAVIGEGPRRRFLEEQAVGLPVRFFGHVADRELLAGLLATADVAIAPGPVETFGLAALEALASGTPVVVSNKSALPEVVGLAGIAVDDNAAAYADAVEQLLEREERQRRVAARAQAERFDWQTSVDGFLAAHGLEPSRLSARRLSASTSDVPRLHG